MLFACSFVLMGRIYLQGTEGSWKEENNRGDSLLDTCTCRGKPPFAAY